MQKKLRKKLVDISERVSENQLQEQEKIKVIETGKKETKPLTEPKKEEPKKEASKPDTKKEEPKRKKK